jgi:hypothetical protein
MDRSLGSVVAGERGRRTSDGVGEAARFEMGGRASARRVFHGTDFAEGTPDISRKNLK